MSKILTLLAVVFISLSVSAKPVSGTVNAQAVPDGGNTLLMLVPVIGALALVARRKK